MKKRFCLIRDCKPEATLGRLLEVSNGKELCKTLERPNLNNERDNPLTPKNESSCIPEGVYQVKKYSSNKFPDHWEITNVPNRSAILFHKGNWVSEIFGCVIVATSIINMNPKNDPNIPPEKKYMASQSAAAWEKFKKVMPKEFELEITSLDSMCKVLD